MLAEMTLKLNGEITMAKDISQAGLMILLRLMAEDGCTRGAHELSASAERSQRKPTEDAMPQRKPSTADKPQRKSSTADKLQVDIDELRYLYHDENLSAEACAAKLGVNVWAIRRLISDNGLQKGRGKRAHSGRKGAIALNREQFRELAMADMGLEADSV